MNKRTFEEVWATVRARHVLGWLSPDEAYALYLLAEAADGPVLEVGSFCGLSTCFLAGAGTEVWSVDPHDPAMHSPSQANLLAGRDTAGELAANVEAIGAGELHLVRGTSAQAAASPELPGEFALVFIDGDHSDAGITLDVALWEPRVVAGGILAFHDWIYSGDEAEPWHIAAIVTAALDPERWLPAVSANALRAFKRSG